MATWLVFINLIEVHHSFLRNLTSNSKVSLYTISLKNTVMYLIAGNPVDSNTLLSEVINLTPYIVGKLSAEESLSN